MVKQDLTQQLKELQALADKAKVIGQLKKLIAQRNTAMARVSALDDKIAKLVNSSATAKPGSKRDRKAGTRKKTAGSAMPTPGSAPYKLVEVMDPKKPMHREEIAKKIGLTVNTVNQYLQKFKCFKNAGRGKGYICTKSTARPASPAAKKKTVKRKTKKKTVKKS